jgi:hypothetical protein
MRSVHLAGPFKFQGSNRFINIYKKNTFESFVNIFYLPDTAEKTLIHDCFNGVDMSTFLDNGYIMLKIFHRFLIFTEGGVFVTEVIFGDYKIMDTLVASSSEFSLKNLC